MLCCSKPSLNPKPKRPQPTPRKMNDTYAVVNKSKQLPATTTHHYDNIELGGPKGKPPSSTAAPALPPSSTEVYSTVKPKGRPGARSPAPLTLPIFDTAGPGKQRAGEAPAALAKDHRDYELVPGERGGKGRKLSDVCPFLSSEHQD